MKVLVIFVVALIGASSATVADQTTINNQYAAILSLVTGNFTANRNLFVATLSAASPQIISTYNGYIAALNSQRSALSGSGLTALNNYVTIVTNSRNTANAFFTTSALTTAITNVINNKTVQYINPVSANVSSAAAAAVSNNKGIICWNKYSPLIRNAYNSFLTNLNSSVAALAVTATIDGGLILANYTGQATGPTGIQNSAWVNCQPWGWNCNPYVRNVKKPQSFS